MLEAQRSIPEDHRKRRQIALTTSAWAVREVLLEQHESALQELLASFRAGKPAQERDPLVAKLCAVDELLFTILKDAKP